MDLCSIALPLINEQKKTVAAITVSLDMIRGNNPGIFEKAKTKLIEKGQLISRLLGYKGAYPKIFRSTD